MTLPVIPPFISGSAQLGEFNPPGGVWLQAYPFCLHRRWVLGERDHLMLRRSAPTGPQRALVWWGPDLDKVISPFVHQGIIRRHYAHREGSIYDGELYALAVVFSGRLILGQPWADSYPHRYKGDSDTVLTPIRAEMFKNGAASTVDLPSSAVLIEAPGHEEGELTLDPRDFLGLVWQSLPGLIELLKQARPNPGETADTFPWRELGLPTCPGLIPY